MLNPSAYSLQKHSSDVNMTALWLKNACLLKILGNVTESDQMDQLKFLIPVIFFVSHRRGPLAQKAGLH